jgi:hypothetical protein
MADPSFQLKRGLLEGQHFVTVSEAVWDALRAWHDGGPMLRRYTALIDGVRGRSLLLGAMFPSVLPFCPRVHSN